MSTIEFSSYFFDLQPKLLPAAYRLTNNLEDAKDLIQETALRAFNHREKFEMGTNFRAWVITIMRNTFINIYRKKKNRATFSEPSDSHVFLNFNRCSENLAMSNMMMSDLKVILNDLPAIYSKPFQLFYEGYKYEEIADLMEVPIGTIKSRIFFARQKLMEHINRHFHSEVTLN